MKISKIVICLSSLLLLNMACGGSNADIDTIDNAANAWCDIADKAVVADGSEEKSLLEQLNDLETRIEQVYSEDKAWIEEFWSKVEKNCPEAREQLQYPEGGADKQKTEPLL